MAPRVVYLANRLHSSFNPQIQITSLIDPFRVQLARKHCRKTTEIRRQIQENQLIIHSVG